MTENVGGEHLILLGGEGERILRLGKGPESQVALTDSGGGGEDIKVKREVGGG